MTASRVTPDNYIDFLIGTPKVCSALEAARVQPEHPSAPAHDAFTRLLQRLEPDPTALWNEVAALFPRTTGVLVVDDSTLDKPYATQIDLVGYHWSGKHRGVVRGINLISLVWTDGDRLYPCDYRVCDKTSGQTKNDHFLTMLKTAKERGFQPECILFDGWYASLENLKAVRGHGWRFLSRMKSNRLVRWDRGEPKAISDQPIAATGTSVWLPGFGMVKVFRIVAKDGDTTHWFTGDLEMGELERMKFAEQSWAVEQYHRGIKQHCGVEKCQVRSATGQRNHIGFAIRALVRLEYQRYTRGWTWFQAKTQVIRSAVRAYLAQPLYTLPRAT